MYLLFVAFKRFGRLVKVNKLYFGRFWHRLTAWFVYGLFWRCLHRRHFLRLKGGDYWRRLWDIDFRLLIIFFRFGLGWWIGLNFLPQRIGRLAGHGLQ